MNDQKIQLVKQGDDILVNGKLSEYEIEKVGEEYLLYKDNNISKLRILKQDGPKLQILLNGKEASITVKDHIALTLEKLGMDVLASEIINEVTAPMPGVILEVMAKENQDVQKGDPLLILEAMKMENMIKSPTDGKIKSIAVAKGQSVEKNALLIQFE